MSTTTSEKINQLKNNINEFLSVKRTLQTKFNIDQDIPFRQYPDRIYPNETTQLVFYKCFNVNYQPSIPAYDNLTITGVSTPSDLNGILINNSPHLAETNRTYTHQNGNYILKCNNNIWQIYQIGSQQYLSNAVCYGHTFKTSQTGNSNNPYKWDTIKLSSGNSISQAFNINNLDSQYGSDYVYVKLKAGTTYKFGLKRDITINEEDYWQLSLYLYLYNGISNQQDSQSYIEYSSSSSNQQINEIECTNVITFTPDNDGYYRIAMGGYVDGAVQGNLSYVCYPAPEQHVQLNLTSVEFIAGYNGNYDGDMTISNINVPATQGKKEWSGYKVYTNTNQNGVTYYKFAETVTSGLTYTNMQPSIGQICSADGNIKVNYMYTGQEYAEDQTVLKFLMSQNSIRRFIIYSTGKNNIIQWGDDTTTVLSQNISDYQHTYTNAGYYIIKIKGSGVYGIKVSVSTTNSGFATSPSNSNSSLIQILNFSQSISDLYQAFCNCTALKSIRCQLPQNCTSFTYTFYGCSNLEYVPDTWLLVNNADYCYFLQNCKKITANITNWFNNFKEHSHKNFNAYDWFRQAFSNCEHITGYIPQNKLWKDPSWYYTDSNSSYEVFYNCKNLSNYNQIEDKWK